MQFQKKCAHKSTVSIQIGLRKTLESAVSKTNVSLKNIWCEVYLHDDNTSVYSK